MTDIRIMIVVTFVAAAAIEITVGAACIWSEWKSGTIEIATTPALNRPAGCEHRTAHERLKTLPAPTAPRVAAENLLQSQLQWLQRQFNRPERSR